MPAHVPLQTSSIRRIMLRMHGVDLFAKAFIVANLLGLVLVWSYSQKQEATRRKYEAIITSELASLQGRMSSLQQEAEKNHVAIGQMKEAIEVFIDSDNESHQKLMGILGAAQKELLLRPRKPAQKPIMQPGGLLPELDDAKDLDSRPLAQRPEEENEVAEEALDEEEEQGQLDGDILPNVQEDPAEPPEDEMNDFNDDR
ncbi:hypothetical protein CAPTEDRAFT_219819 [Capitella teleta]|uniref:Uncharacterized protein n=1 Tax=Capitella teleta TaxID=283909 RepID=R7TW09_CAPTE|nr:hypothetical protein CAPTEDRAFT_219819 [Capitella teleta]|eukprot:ELT97894.1 hypothetical protein CAPTEDRAFT_219819 [Capitella teleta]